MTRKGEGRRKIAIEKIENKTNLEFTFSKRRSGLFKKASELSVLCGCHVALVILSAVDKIYAFGNPSAEPIFNWFISGNPQQGSAVQQLLESHRDAELPEMNEEIEEHEAIIEAEKAREKAMNELPIDLQDKNWLITPQEDLTLAEAQGMVAKLEEFKHSIDSSSSLNEWSNRRADGVSLALPPRGSFSGGGPLTPADRHLASTSHGSVGHPCGVGLTNGENHGLCRGNYKYSKVGVLYNLLY